MIRYKKIHIWEFPIKPTFIRLKEDFRIELFKKLREKIMSTTNILDKINNSAKRYNMNRKYNTGHLSSWVKGYKKDGENIRNINIPLWVLIEMSKTLSDSGKINNSIMIEIEKNIEYYTGLGKSNPILNPKLPLYLTPEMISVIFHFMGDGHIGRKTVVSSYRQMNKKGLNNFLKKLQSIFGNFNYPKKEFDNGRLNIPKIITEFYVDYFKLPNTNTFEAYIPKNIKKLKKEFLLAGLISFIVDEGHVGEVITIYGKNKRLMSDIQEIGIKCGYLCHPLREKYAYGKFGVYRFSISSKDYGKFYKDILELSKLFPTCTLAQKMERLSKRIS
ncbi:MAG: hypothetical protein ABIE36_01035 [Candidatus Diapherotrites archaeon]